MRNALAYNTVNLLLLSILMPLLLSGSVDIEYNNSNESIIISNQNLTEKIKIEYTLLESNELFSNELHAKLEGKTYVLIKNEDICIRIADQRDFDNNGSKDVLIENVIGCGGNCCANSYFFYSYLGDGHFQRSDDFGYSWDEPLIEKWKGLWSVVVTSTNEGFNQEAPVEIKERYVLDNGEAIRVEYSERKSLISLIEMKSDEFDIENIDEIRTIYFDIDRDGVDDKIEGQLWERWGRIIWKVVFSSGKTFTCSECSCKRIGIAESSTNGVHDLICDLDDIYKWDGRKYVK